ncbi:MAG: hypothetical protein ABIH52_02455 [Candidatus Aenigmatarchaeota archaeon]
MNRNLKILIILVIVAAIIFIFTLLNPGPDQSDLIRKSPEIADGFFNRIR